MRTGSTGSQLLITEPLGMQFLITELLRGETRTMYKFSAADAIDDPEEAHESLVHAALLDVHMREVLMSTMPTICNFSCRTS